MKQAQQARKPRARSAARKQPRGNMGGNRSDVKVRGNPKQLMEKYKTQARDALQSGDRVQYEYFMQFADHYQRVLNEIRGPQDAEERRGSSRSERHEELNAAEARTDERAEDADTAPADSPDAEADDTASAHAPAPRRGRGRRRSARPAETESDANVPEDGEDPQSGALNGAERQPVRKKTATAGPVSEPAADSDAEPLTGDAA